MDAKNQRQNNVGGVTGKGFKPGQSGNPNGRPKGTSLTARLRVAIEKPEPGDERPVADRLVAKLITLALEGDRQAIKDVFERVDGKVPDKLEADLKSGDDNGQIVAVILKALDQFPDAKVSVAQALRGYSIESDRDGDGVRPGDPHGVAGASS